MNDRALIRTGAIGASVATLCCATPVLAVVLPALGLGAYLAGADYVLVPLLLACLGLVAFGLYRRRAAAAACCATETSNQDRSL